MDTQQQSIFGMETNTPNTSSLNSNKSRILARGISSLLISVVISFSIVVAFNSITNFPLLMDLSGNWETCFEENNGDCQLKKVFFPGQLPREFEKFFSGRATLSRKFLAPTECLTGQKACSLLINEMGDAGKIFINGSLLGVRGFQGQHPTYEKHYPVQIDLPQKILLGENQISIELYSNKFMQTGLTKPPLGIAETSVGRNFLKSKVFYNVFLPLVSAAILIAFIFCFNAFPLGNIRKSKSFTYARLYCILSILFLFSFSEIPREFISMQIASPLHFLLRYLSDFSLFLLLRTFSDNNAFVKSKYFIIYFITSISPFLIFICIGIARFFYPELIDTSFLTYNFTRFSWPMKLLPFVPLFFIIKKNQTSIHKSKLLLLTSCLLLVFQLNDIILFFGFIKSIYFIKFYPVIICFITMGYLVYRSRQIEEESRLHNSHREAIFKTTQMLAHDIKTPFAKLHAVMNMFKKSVSNDDALLIITDKIPDIEHALNKVESLISDILSYSHSSELDLTTIEPKIFFEKLIHQLQETMDCTNIEVNLSIVFNDSLVGDQSKLSRAILNICRNAVEAMHGAGKLGIEVTSSNSINSKYLKINISNSGPSIPEIVIPKIFDSFYTNKKQTGTGLGLSITKTFIESHGGQIWCESGLKQGVKFSILLPLPLIKNHINTTINIISEHQIRLKPQLKHLLPNGYKSSALSILVIEDEPIYQKYISDLLESYSTSADETFSICIAHDFDTAIAEFNIRQPDFIILDLDLGNFSKSGYDFLTYIQKHPSEPFICIHSNQPYFEKCIEHKIDAIIPKPMTQTRLQALVYKTKFKKTATKEVIPKVAIVDDDVVLLSAWKEEMADADVVCFSDHELFWDAVLDSPHKLRSFSAIILDYYYPGTNVDNLRLVNSIRSRGFSGPIILSTNAPYRNDGKDKFDAVINKTPLLFFELIDKIQTIHIGNKQV